MDKFKLFFQGILIGIGKIIPGVSGSMIAISLGIYEKFVYYLSNIFSNFKKSILYLIPLCLGISLSIILGSRIILFFLNNYYFVTMMLFIGLITGGIPSIYHETKKEKNKNNLLILTLPFIFLLLFDIMINKFDFNINYTCVSAFFLGIIEAISSIIPGISGTAIMMMLGVYNDVLETLSTIMYIDKLIFFVIGLIIGIIMISKIINYFLKKHKTKTYYCILGFVFSSILILFRNLIYYKASIYSIFLGIILFILGYFISSKLE